MAEKVTLREILPFLDDPEDRGTYWTALCPLHDEPVRLSLKQDEYGLRLRCSAGCRFDNIVEKVLPGRAVPVTPLRIAIGDPFDSDPPLSPGLRSVIPDILEAVAEKLKLENEETPQWDL